MSRLTQGEYKRKTASQEAVFFWPSKNTLNTPTITSRPQKLLRFPAAKTNKTGSVAKKRSSSGNEL
jgi:hypothetical protein